MLPRIEKDRSNIPISTSFLHDKEYNNMQYISNIKNTDTCKGDLKIDRRRTSSEKRVFGAKVY
jgi:hypothetical protein